MPIFPFNKYTEDENINFKPSKLAHTIDGDKNSMFSMRMVGDPIEIRSYVWVADQKQEVVVDSGSIALIVPSIACTSCAQPKPYYKPSKNVVFIDCNSTECSQRNDFCVKTKVHPDGICGSQIHYLDNTVINSFLVKDDFRMADDMENMQIIFGSIFSQQGGHPLKYGIMGMGNTCQKCNKSPIDAIFEGTDAMQRTFALWLDENYSGVMTLGDLDPQYSTGSLKYTPLMAIDTIHYGILPSYATITSKVGESLVLTSKEIGVTLLDTGSSYTLLAENAYESFRKFVQQNCTIEGTCGEKTIFDGYCMNLKDSDIEKFPVIELGLLGDVTLEIPPQSYIVSVYQNGIEFRCLGVKKSPLSKRSIVGLSWLRNTYVVFDKEHNRLGIGKKAKAVPIVNIQPQPLTSTNPIHPNLNNLFPKPPNATKNPHNAPSVTIEKKILSTRKICDFAVKHESVGLDTTSGFSQYDVSISNFGSSDVKDLKVIMTDNLYEIASVDKQYNFDTHSFAPTLDIGSQSQSTFRYTSKNNKIVDILFPEHPECNQNYDQEQSNIIKEELVMYNNGNDYEHVLKDTAMDYVIADDPKSIIEKMEEMEQYVELAKQLESTQGKEELFEEEEQDANINALLSRPKPFSKVKKSDSLSNRCPYQFSQRKGYEWRDSSGITYSFWEVELTSMASTNITSIILSTLDDVYSVINMDYSIQELNDAKTKIFSLPKTKVLASNGSYRWLYCTRNESVTFSIVSTDCLNSTTTTTPK